MNLSVLTQNRLLIAEIKYIYNTHEYTLTRTCKCITAAKYLHLRTEELRVSHSGIW